MCFWILCWYHRRRIDTGDPRRQFAVGQCARAEIKYGLAATAEPGASADERDDSFLKHGIVAQNNGRLPNAKIRVDDAFDFRSRYVYVGAADHGLEARFAGLIGLIDTPMPFSANKRTKTSG